MVVDSHPPMRLLGLLEVLEEEPLRLEGVEAIGPEVPGVGAPAQGMEIDRELFLADPKYLT